MSALAHLSPGAVVEARPRVSGLVVDQVGYAIRELWRSRIVLIFTFLIPFVWLVLIGILAGNEAVDATSGVRVMQYATPMAAVMGLLFAAYPPVAMSLAQAREQGITKRLAGTPLPAWAYLVGRVVAAVILATLAVVAMLAIGVAAYEVQIQWRSAAATIVTLVLGAGCLAAIGLAVGALAPSASVAQTFAIGSAVVVSFVSGLFVWGSDLPDWLDTVGSLFPVRHLLVPLQDQFDPYKTGSGFSIGDLAVLVAWGLGAVIVAAWALRREPRVSSAPPPAVRSADALASAGLRAVEAARPSELALIADQTRWANRTTWRDAGWLFFAIGLPVGLYALMATMYSDISFRPAGVPFVLYFACGMAVYGASVTAFINLPEVVARARDRGVLKRLRGTPLTSAEYLGGRTVSVLWIGLLTGVLVFAVAIAFFGVEVAAGGVPLAIAELLFGTLTIAACGYALAALAPSGRAVGVIGLAILLPLAFISDVFVIGNTPDWMVAIASVFPLRPFVRALVAALDPAGSSIAWTELGVLAAWLIGATLVALRFFRWSPRA